jgi:ribonucleotide monophosphatase NagD (HAD superfamily)
MSATRSAWLPRRDFEDSGGGIPLKFITNTMRRPRRRIAGDLAGMGRRAALDDFYRPAAIARDFLVDRNLTPFLVVHPDLREDFSGLRPVLRKPSLSGMQASFSRMI